MVCEGNTTSLVYWRGADSSSEGKQGGKSKEYFGHLQQYGMQDIFSPII